MTRPVPMNNVTSCTQTRLSSRQPCVCHYDVCVGWYPCGLKYCRGKDSAGRIVSYRCGIKTCSRCRQFQFRVDTKLFCVWDEAEYQPVFVDSASLHSADDQVDMRGWRDDDDAFVGHYLNDSLPRNHFASLLDFGGGSDQVVRLKQRHRGRMDDQKLRTSASGLLVKPTALDDDEDVD